MRNDYSGWRPEPDRTRVKELLLKDAEANPTAFRNEIIRTRTPVKLIGGFAETEFECAREWSNDFLRERCREERETVIVEVADDDDETDDGTQRFGKGSRERMQFDQFLSAFEGGDHSI